MKKALASSRKYQILLVPDPEGGYVVQVPALPGCITYGKTQEKAYLMAEDAIAGYVASLRKHGEPVPPSDYGVIVSMVEVSAY